jgi:hypothetical protein
LRPVVGSARGRAATALVVGAVLLALTWRASPLPSPPMYEGLTTPAAPYVYLHPSPGLESKNRPSSARASVPLRQGQSPPLDPQTSENPPQAQLLAARDSFLVPPGASAVVASIVAVDPPAATPLGGAVQGNVYRFTVSAGGTPLTVRPGHTVTVVLRGPAGIPTPTIELFASGSWTRLPTVALGTLSGDSYTANVGSLGDFALVGSAAPPSGGGRDPFLVVLAVAAVVLTGSTLLTLRRQRRRAPPPPARPRRRPPPRGR